MQYPINAHSRQTPRCSHNSYSSSIHQTFTVSQQLSLRSLGHIQSHGPLWLLHFTLPEKETDEHCWMLLCMCVCSLIVIGCYWVSLAVCFHSHSRSFSLSFQLVSSFSHLLSRVTHARLFLLHRIISCIFYSRSVTVVCSNDGLH